MDLIGSYNPTISLLLTNLSLLWGNYWRTLRTGTNRATDTEQFMRSNAATPSRYKRATRNCAINNHIAEHHLQTNHRIDWDSAKCVTYSTDYYQQISLESWSTNLEQTPLNRRPQLPAPYKRLIWRHQQDRHIIDKPTDFRNNRPTEIWEGRPKSTNHLLQSVIAKSFTT